MAASSLEARFTLDEVGHQAQVLANRFVLSLQSDPGYLHTISEQNLVVYSDRIGIQLTGVGVK